MYKIMTVWDMQDEFKAYNRENYFSDEGLTEIDNFYMESSAENCPVGCEKEFDVIGISCDWNEYGNGVVLGFDDFVDDFKYLIEDEENYNNLTQEEKFDKIFEELEERTYCARLDNGNILQMIF